MNRYPAGTDCNSMQNDIDELQEQLDAALDRLDYTEKGLAEWRSIASLTLKTLADVVDNAARDNEAVRAAKRVLSQFYNT